MLVLECRLNKPIQPRPSETEVERVARRILNWWSNRPQNAYRASLLLQDMCYAQTLDGPAEPEAVVRWAVWWLWEQGCIKAAMPAEGTLPAMGEMQLVWRDDPPEHPEAELDATVLRATDAAWTWWRGETRPVKEQKLVIVDLPKRQITHQGKVYDCSSVQTLRWLKVLAEHPGEWISSSCLTDHDPELEGARTNKLKAFLPEAIRSLIESQSGAGSRLKL